MAEVAEAETDKSHSTIPLSYHNFNTSRNNLLKQSSLKGIILGSHNLLMKREYLCFFLSAFLTLAKIWKCEFKQGKNFGCSVLFRNQNPY